MTVVSVLHLNRFVGCPYVGASAQGPLPTLVNPPVNAFLPVITGALTVGSVLTTTTGAWSGEDPITYAYQWQRAGVDIPSAIYKTYVIDPNDVGFLITVRVTATNDGGDTTATAQPVGPIGGLLNAALPIITGALSVGTTLVTDNGQWVGTPPPTFAYSWQRDGVDIPGAVTNSYLLTSAETGKLITSRVIATNVAGSVGAYSAQMGPVTETLTNTAVPVITGDVIIGAVLSTTTGTWTGTQPITYAYQWKKDGVNIAGATSASYVVTTNDVGGMINVVVTATNSIGNLSVASANTIGPIIPPATLAVSNLLTSKGTAIGATIGAISVVGGSGSFTYTLIGNPSNQFAISGSNLTVATALSGGSYSITVRASGGVPAIVTQTFTVRVAALALSGASVAQDSEIGTVVGSFSVIEGTGSYTYTLTSDPSSLFAISGSDLVVAAELDTGSYPISVQATGGTPASISDSFMITVMIVVIAKVEGAWYGGLPYPGIVITANKVGTQKYWYGGLPSPILKD